MNLFNCIVKWKFHQHTYTDLLIIYIFLCFGESQFVCVSLIVISRKNVVNIWKALKDIFFIT